MASEKQSAANKRNAQNSSGPGSAAGKAASRMNALKTGLYAKSLVIRGESQEEFDELVQQFNGQYHPVTPQARVSPMGARGGSRGDGTSLCRVEG